MLGDVWAFDVRSKKGEEVHVQGDGLPLARGWFDVDVVDSSAILVQGGPRESKEQPTCRCLDA